MTEFVKIKEGKAEILFPNENQVFYNPVQEFNRDISTAVIRTWANLVRKEQSVKKNALNSDEIQFTMLEALSASGLRSIRYAKEMPSIIKYILANDLSPDAVESIKRNVLHNELSVDKVIPNLGDAWYIQFV